MKKPELLATAGSQEELVRLIEAGADAVQIGEQRYGLRLSGNIERSALKEAVSEAHKRGAKVYVVANAIMDNRILPELPDYLQSVGDSEADAVVFGDPSVLIAAKQAGVAIPLHWNPEMTATNYAAANYWGKKGATRAILARELNMEQVLEFKKQCAIEVQVQVHGATNILHSKRRLVTNYFHHLGQTESNPADAGMEKGLFLKEEERPEERFPIFEDANGTHIMSSDDICMLENLHELIEGGIDSFKIEGLLKPLAYNETTVRVYRQAIDTYVSDPDRYNFRQEWLEAIERMQPEDRPLSFGFFYKEQVY